MLFKVVVGFLFGLGGGVYLFFKYIDDRLPQEKVLSEKVEYIEISLTATLSPTPSSTSIQTPSFTPTLPEAPTSTEVPTKNTYYYQKT